MLRLASQQGVKALCKPLRHPPRNPLYNPLRNPPHARHVHTEGAPFSGPPSYTTIARRFLSQPNPSIYLTEKKAREAIKRNEFIDIHDIGPVDPKDYDVLLTDINDNILRGDVAELVGIPYLEKATKGDANNVVAIGHGVIYGKTLRTIFPCVVSFQDKAHWVFFIVDSGSPLTFISSQAAGILGLKNDYAPVRIAGYHHLVNLSPKDSHFSDVNILGADFCSSYIPVSQVDINDRSVKLYFSNNKWVVKAQL